MKSVSYCRMRSMLVGFVIAFLVARPGVSSNPEGIPPIANAGLSRYVGPDPIVLDATGSYDPDNSGLLRYTWRQISGPAIVIKDEDTARPTIGGSMQPGQGRDPTPKVGGFAQTDAIQECELELVVSDGELTSLPDIVTVTIVPYFGSSTLKLENASFDANKPTVIYFGGGDCINGYPGQPWNGGPAWMNRANVIGFPSGYTPDSSTTEQTYYKYGDMIIVYLSATAPEYKQPIQMIGWSTGGMPAIDAGIHMNQVYRDPRYAVNHVTHLDVNPACRDTYLSMVVYLDSVKLFLTSSVNEEQCWIDFYYGTAAYPYEPMSRSNFLWVRTELPHNDVPNWYRNSLAGSDMNNFNSGVVGGAYWSVIGPGKNLQLAPETGVYYFRWKGNAQTGAMDFFRQSEYPGRLPEPVKLLVWEYPGLVKDDPNSIFLTCMESENALGYQLISGSDPYNIVDYNVVAESNTPPEVTVAMLPSSDRWWTVKVHDAHGSTIYADPIRVGLPTGITAYWKLDEVEGNIAEDTAGYNHGTVYGEPQWQPAGGKRTGSLQLDGIDDYISTDFVINPALGPFSVLAWIQGSAPGGVVISQTDGLGGSGETWLGIEPSGGKLVSGLASTYTGGFVAVPLASESVITDGQWHHIGFVWDGAYRCLYMDGVEVAQDIEAQVPLKSATGGLHIGAGKTLDATSFFSGMIDDIRVYSIALGAEEIAALEQ